MMGFKRYSSLKEMDLFLFLSFFVEKKWIFLVLLLT